MPMRTPYLTAARVKLQERKNACLKATYLASKTYLGQLYDLLNTSPIFGPITAELASTYHGKYPESSSLYDPNRHVWLFPDTEKECAAFYLRGLECASRSANSFGEFGCLYFRQYRQYQDQYGAFLSDIVVPLCSYMDGQVDDGDLLLYMLCRYQREAAWFHSDQLLTLLDSTDSRKTEDAFDKHLRAWLFREGIDFPFSTPKSPSGRADVVIWQGEKPLPIEIKVCDDQNRDAGHVAQGLWQAARYAIDYGKAVGYLVVFNASDRPLTFEGNVSTDGPPCVVTSGGSVFVIVVNVRSSRETASKEKPVAPRLVKTPQAAS